MGHLFLQLISPFPLVFSEFTGGDISQIHLLGVKNDLFPLIYGRLQEFRKTAVDSSEIDSYLDAKESLFIKNVSRSARQEALGQHVLSIFEKSGIPALVLRGDKIARELYGDPNMRSSSDVDILIKMSDALRADSILSKAGYQRNDSLPLGFWFYRIHHGAYSDSETGDLIEVHWSFSIPSFFKLSSEEIWDNVLSGTSSQYRLSPEMNVIMLLIHHHMHLFRELRILVDLLWAFYKYDDKIDWHEFLIKIKRIGLVKTMQIALKQIQILWTESAEEIPSIRILSSELETLRYRNPRLLLSFFRIDIDKRYCFQDYKDKLIARFALDRPSTIFASYVKTLFPAPEAIKELYKDRRNWVLPFNYTRFIKWRLKDWTRHNQCC